MKHAFLAAALALGACATVPLAGAPIRSDGFARLGEATRVGRVVATPLRIVEDSRCPMNARCIWAGRVVVTTRIDGPGWRETTNMELGRPYVAHGQFGLQLSSVQPEKMAGSQPPPRPYLFGYSGR